MKKKISLAIVALIAAATIFMSGVKAQEALASHSQVRTLETVYYQRANVPSMEIVCDAPRGNIVYALIGDDQHQSGRPTPVAVAAVHQPDLCKVEK